MQTSVLHYSKNRRHILKTEILLCSSFKFYSSSSFSIAVIIIITRLTTTHKHTKIKPIFMHFGPVRLGYIFENNGHR